MNAVRAHRASPDASATERARSQKGNALVEFAFVLPVFLILVFGMITYSIALYDKIILTMATRNGARAGAIYGISDDATRISTSKTKTQTDTGLANLISFGSAGVVDVPVPAITSGILTVTATYSYTGLYLFSSSPMTIEAKTSMRVEN
jgi:Flp pilus assembly protein TadG